MESIAIEDKVKGYDKGLLKISHLSYFGIFPKKRFLAVDICEINRNNVVTLSDNVTIKIAGELCPLFSMSQK